MTAMIEFAVANWPWVLLAAASAAGLTWTLLRDNAQVMDQTDAVVWVKRGKGVYIDMRSSADFARGRIADARNIPADELKQRAGEIDRYREKPVVLVCQNGTQSRRQTRQLSDLGFKQVRALRGGMNAWLDAQLPIFTK